MNDILTLDRNYEPHSWIPREEAIVLEAKDLVLDHFGSELVIYHGGTCRATGKQSSLITSSIIVIDGAPSAKAYKVPSLTNASLFQRDRCMCAFCGQIFKLGDLTRDHLIPVSKGGKNKWTNVVTACKKCNAIKDSTLPGHKLPNGILGPQGTGKMDPLYVPYVPCKAEALILRNRNIKADQMEFLLERIKNKNTSRIYQELRLAH